MGVCLPAALVAEWRINQSILTPPQLRSQATYRTIPRCWGARQSSRKLLQVSHAIYLGLWWIANRGALSRPRIRGLFCGLLLPPSLLPESQSWVTRPTVFEPRAALGQVRLRVLAVGLALHFPSRVPSNFQLERFFATAPAASIPPFDTKPGRMCSLTRYWGDTSNPGCTPSIPPSHPSVSVPFLFFARSLVSADRTLTSYWGILGACNRAARRTRTPRAPSFEARCCHRGHSSNACRPMSTGLSFPRRHFSL